MSATPQKPPARLTAQLGIILCSSLLLAHPGCAGPGLPGLPRPPGLGQTAPPKPPATFAVSAEDGAITSE
jgi:hypothetical protein